VIGRGGLLQALDRVSESILKTTESAEEGEGGFRDFGRFLGILTTSLSVLAKGLGSVRGIALGFAAALTKLFEGMIAGLSKVAEFLQKIPGLGGRFQQFIEEANSQVEILGDTAEDLGRRAEESFRGIGAGIKEDFAFIKDLTR
jgi:hypothetical protein